MDHPVAFFFLKHVHYATFVLCVYVLTDVALKHPSLWGPGDPLFMHTCMYIKICIYNIHISIDGTLVIGDHGCKLDHPDPTCRRIFESKIMTQHEITRKN